MRVAYRAWIVALTCSALVLVAGGGAARADFSSGSFSYNSGSCSSHVDPISVVFYGYTAFYSQARADFQARSGWGGNDDGAGQYGISHGYCTPMDGQSYSGCGSCDRYHMRYNQTHHVDTKGRYETVATPHYEVETGCGHATRTFTGARTQVINIMSPAYSYSWQYWGNYEARPQCDGTSVANDGWVAWIDLG